MKSAVVVTYEPDIDFTLDMISSLLHQDISVVVVDNTPDISLAQLVNDRVMEKHALDVANKNLFYCAQGNIGLSAAYNVALDIIYKNIPNTVGVMFLDQDSSVAEGNVSQLWDSFFKLKEKTNIGVLGACPIRVDGLPYRIHRTGALNFEGQRYTKVERVISSFSIVPIEVLKELNGFYDDFFIDHIDNDLCYRCRKLGLINIVDENVSFVQRIGEGRITFLGRHITPVSSPFRHYYQARNIILSNRRNGASNSGTIIMLMKRLIAVSIQAIFYGNAVARFKFFSKGICHGIINKSGKLS
ncbi:hypothetical protein NUK32_03965 [Aeromonas caviae]|uniref:hypothetical protein n=1 Tax=Aeromonas caviae TaxID=648 RepID=UPI00214DDD2F|nr:hypothetical protein [Aeromonas caviae]MCR3946103.1 hypothetical protein [Aeromonas caviae]